MKIKYSKSSKAKIGRLFLKLFECMDDNGTYLYKYQFTTNRIIYILSDLLKTTNIADNSAIMRRSISKISMTIKKSSDKSLTHIISELENELSIKKYEKWKVFFQLNVDVFSYTEIATKIVEISDIKQTNFQELKEFCSFNFHTIELIENDIYNTDNSKYLNNPWFSFWISADNSENIFIEAYKRTNLIRSLLNYSLLNNLERHSGNASVLSEILPIRYHIIINEGKTIAHYSYETRAYKYDLISLSNSQIANVTSLLESLNNIPECESKKVIMNTLRLYTEACDNSDSAFAFIIFWSIIDIILPNIDKNKEIIKGIFKEKYFEMQLLIDALYNKRNMIVHHGSVSDISEDDINRIKDIIDSIINFIIGIANEFRTQKELFVLFEKMKNRKELNTEKRIIDYIAENMKDD